MILELAQAYTSAINDSKLPNIESAWTYVCRNESMRAIEDALSHYAQELRPVFERAKQSLSDANIREACRQTKEQAL